MWQPAELFMMIKREDGDDFLNYFLERKKNREGLKRVYYGHPDYKGGSPLTAWP